MIRARVIVLILGSQLLLTPAMLQAQSVFSLDGPGVGRNAVGARARGLGGAELALADTLRGATLNPALTCLVKQVTVGLTLIPQVVWARDDIERRWWTETAFSNISLQIPVRPGCGLATGLRLDRSRRAEIRWTDEFDGAPVDLRLKREGDEFVVPLTLALGERYGCSIAGGVDYLFVSLREELSWDFGRDGFSPTSTVVMERLSAPAPLAAVSFSPAPRGRLSLLYRHRTTLRGDRELNGPIGLTGVKSLKVRYPSLVGVGGSLRQGGLLLAADVLFEAWDDYREEVRGEEVATSTENTITWAVGIEKSGSSDGVSLWERSTLRLGFRRAQLPTTVFGDGSRVYEELVTLGSGWVMGEARGAIDFSLEVGRRGEIDKHGAREKFVRLVVSLVGREPWKKPERRGPWWSSREP